MALLPSVSIIIAVYNARQTIKKCLDSCFAQDYQNKNIIVIDGGSTDGTMEVVLKYKDQIGHLISEPDTGIYNAWNKAVQANSSEWLCFIGADDEWIGASSLSHLVNYASYPVINFVCAQVNKLPHNGNQGVVFGEPWNFSRMKKRMTVAHTGMLHHNSLFKQYGLFNETYRIAGDYEFLLRVGSSISSAYLPEVVVLMGGGGVSSTNLRVVYNEGRRALSENPNIGAIHGWLFSFKFSLWYIRRRFRLILLKQITD